MLHHSASRRLLHSSNDLNKETPVCQTFCGCGHAHVCVILNPYKNSFWINTEALEDGVRRIKNVSQEHTASK